MGLIDFDNNEDINLTDDDKRLIQNGEYLDAWLEYHETVGIVSAFKIFKYFVENIYENFAKAMINLDRDIKGEIKFLSLSNGILDNKEKKEYIPADKSIHKVIFLVDDNIVPTLRIYFDGVVDNTVVPLFIDMMVAFVSRYKLDSKANGYRYAYPDYCDFWHNESHKLSDFDCVIDGSKEDIIGAFAMECNDLVYKEEYIQEFINEGFDPNKRAGKKTN